MEIEEIREYGLNKKGVTESFPFDNETLVMKVGTKIFMMISLESNPLSVNVKTDPEWSQELREQYPQITGAYHMNKTHWNSVMTEGLKKELILTLIDHSYDLVFLSLTKKIREEITNS
ncbi:MmcQ/YjbR family DNA-binding protein [Chryseobacterium sp.]|uniref:MmcQ/YjbR family DNA-binding protein n=1 Tax=Chryseobacterium sp. TaxID=1871047 RepID=UPI0025C0E456|nr:MmcQ/YjbR family DNA-binding protein [Chryseobacterium sp.]